MANQIQGTVYQIDGNPQKAPISVSFLTTNIFIKEASISTIPDVNSAITCYLNTSNQLQEQTFYVSELISDLVSDANVGNASQVQVTVLDINGDPQMSGGVQYSFPADGITVWEVLNSTNGVNSSITFKNKQYGVSETETDIADAANVTSAGVQGPQGIQGPAGPQGALGPVGPAGLNWQGSWVSGTSYVADDAVGYAGASWFCILATSGTTAPNLDTTHWALLASQGAQGLAGATGAQGPTGPQGSQGPVGPQGPSGSSSYQVYSAVVKYTGTGLSVVTLLENTLGATITWASAFLGVTGTASSSVFTNNKTVVTGNPYIGPMSTFYNNVGARASDTTINLFSISTTDGAFASYNNAPFFLEIRVYN